MVWFSGLTAPTSDPLISLLDKELVLRQYNTLVAFSYFSVHQLLAKHLPMHIHKNQNHATQGLAQSIGDSIIHRHQWSEKCHSLAGVLKEERWVCQTINSYVSIHNRVCMCMRTLQAYREHRGSEQTPCKKLQEDDHHGMVNTGLPNSLRLNGDKHRHTGRKAVR